MIAMDFEQVESEKSRENRYMANFLLQKGYVMHLAIARSTRTNSNTPDILKNDDLKPKKISCNDGDSNPDLEHGKLEFYP